MDVLLEGTDAPEIPEEQRLGLRIQVQVRGQGEGGIDETHDLDARRELGRPLQQMIDARIHAESEMIKVVNMSQ